MSTYCGLQEDRLPDITMYAGDTTPWTIPILDESGSAYPVSELSGRECILTFTPFLASHSAIADNVVQPVLTKTASIVNDGTGAGEAVFNFEIADTIDLFGKYIYQLEVTNEFDDRIHQGYVVVKKNYNKPA